MIYDQSESDLARIQPGDLTPTHDRADEWPPLRLTCVFSAPDGDRTHPLRGAGRHKGESDVTTNCAKSTMTVAKQLLWLVAEKRPKGQLYEFCEYFKAKKINEIFQF